MLMGSPEHDLEYPELLYASDSEADSSNDEFDESMDMDWDSEPILPKAPCICYY